MKTIIVLAALALSIGAAAQDVQTTSIHGSTYCTSMMNGKLVVMMNQKEITSDVMFPNGAKLTTDGIFTKSDGKQFTLKSGECVDENGIVNKKKATGMESDPVDTLSTDK